MIEKQLLVKVMEPENLILLGSSKDDDFNNRDFMVDDDETCFVIHIEEGGDLNVGSDGFGSVVTVEEFLKWAEYAKEEYGENWYDDITGAALLRDFSGDISITARLEDGTYSSNFDIDDYIQHQLDDEYPCAVVVLPSGSKVTVLKDTDHLHSLLNG